jgi:small subunit ribosomal protein S4
MYGLLERQFRNYFHKAEKMTGETGTNLLQLLECRLDNVVYRLGLASTRAQARQLVSHAHFLLNNRKCNYPSSSVKPGDIIHVRDRSKKMDIIMNSMKRIKGDIELPWLELDKAKMTGTFLAVPERDEMALTVNEQLVVELYSK